MTVTRLVKPKKLLVVDKTLLDLVVRGPAWELCLCFADWHFVRDPDRAQGPNSGEPGVNSPHVSGTLGNAYARVSSAAGFAWLSAAGVPLEEMGPYLGRDQSPRYHTSFVEEPPPQRRKVSEQKLKFLGPMLFCCCLSG